MKHPLHPRGQLEALGQLMPRPKQMLDLAASHPRQLTHSFMATLAV